MPRPATGQVIVRATRSGQTSFAIRYRARGARVFEHLGYAPAWSRKRAEEELANTLADVRRGVWLPPDQRAPEPPPRAPTLHEFASAWYAAREAGGLRPRSLEYLRWALTDHLLPALGDVPVDRVTVEDVDRYAGGKAAERMAAQQRIAALTAKLAEREEAGRPAAAVTAELRDARRAPGLSNASTNKTLGVLAQVMALAVEYGHATTNPAHGKRRRLPTSKPTRLFLEPGQVGALLDAARRLDDEDRGGRRYRRALLATLAFGGLRVGEALALRWRDVDLAAGSVRVCASKTDAGVRAVDLQPELYDELTAHRAVARRSAPGDLVFGTATGAADNRNNVRRRVLLRAVARANERIAEEGGCEPLPDGLSPHALRRSFASWLVAEGEDAAYVMAQIGHSDPGMTLGLYAKALRSKRRRPHARRVHDGPDLDALGQARGTSDAAAAAARAAAPTA